MPVNTSFHKLTEADIGFIPDIEKLYKEQVKGFKKRLKALEKRYKIFSQQQVTFITALDHCRQIAMEAHAPILNLFQVSNYQLYVADDKTDRRVLTIFVDLVDDLNELHKDVVNLTNQTDYTLEKIYHKWSKTLSPREDLRLIKTKKSNPQLNYLGLDEVDNHFGGIVNVLPAALELAKSGIERLEEIKAYLPESTPNDESIQRTLKKLNSTASRMQTYPTPKFNRIVTAQ